MFPPLYLPVMEEANKRTLRPWRMWLPTPPWWLFRKRLSQLDTFLKGRLRARWHERAKGARCPERPDLVDSIMHSLEVRHCICPTYMRHRIVSGTSVPKRARGTAQSC